MKSPFPGMDPYLEEHWRDVHHNLITFAQGELNATLPRQLLARVEERVFIESPEGIGRSVYPDIRVIEHPRPERGGTAAVEAGVAVAEAGMAVAESIIVRLPDEEVTEGFIEIIDAGSGNRVITVIEVLSISNKQPGPGQDQYLQKQRELRAGKVSLVEIDLLRAGHRVQSVRPEHVPPSHRTPYQVCVRRGWRGNEVQVCRVPLRERLPRIPIPLRQTDKEAYLDLQVLIDQCYRNGRYDDLDYKQAPNPPLDAEDAAWADALLRAAGRR